MVKSHCPCTYYVSFCGPRLFPFAPPGMNRTTNFADRTIWTGDNLAIPRGGGQDNISNPRLMCAHCNRGSYIKRPVAEFRPMVRWRVASRRRSPHCRKSNVTELQSHTVSSQIQPPHSRYLDTVVGKTRCNPSVEPIYPCAGTAPSALLIPAVVRPIVIT